MTLLTYHSHVMRYMYRLMLTSHTLTNGVIHIKEKEEEGHSYIPYLSGELEQAAAAVTASHIH